MGPDAATSQDAPPQPRRRAGRPRQEGLEEHILDAAVAEMSRVGCAHEHGSVAAQPADEDDGLRSVPIEGGARDRGARAHAPAHPREPLSGNVREDLIRELTLFREGVAASVWDDDARRRPRRGARDARAARAVPPPRDRAAAGQHSRWIIKAGRDAGQVSGDADVEIGITMLIGSLYSAYTAGRPPGRDWPRKVVDAWLCANGTPA